MAKTQEEKDILENSAISVSDLAEHMIFIIDGLKSLVAVVEKKYPEDKDFEEPIAAMAFGIGRLTNLANEVVSKNGLNVVEAISREDEDKAKDIADSLEFFK